MISSASPEDLRHRLKSCGKNPDALDEVLCACDELMREQETVIDSISDGLWICDGDANVLRINRTAELFHSVKAAQVVGRNMRQLVAEGICDRSATLEVIRTRSPVHMLLQRYGRKLVLTGLPVFDDTGKLIRVVVNEHDITELESLRRRTDGTDEASGLDIPLPVFERG